MKKESAIQTKVRNRALKELGVIGKKLNIDGDTGWPDFIFFIPGGRPLFIEFKRPGQEPSPKQIYIHDEVLKKLNYDVEVHDDENEAIKAIRHKVEAAQRAIKSNKIRPR